MTKKWAVFVSVLLFVFVMSAGSLYGETENSILNLSGGREGYSTAILTDPDRIPVFVIQPVGNTRLEEATFELVLSNAKWDFFSFRERGVDNYGEVNQDGVFTPLDTRDGYLTGGQEIPGVMYELKVGDKDHIAIFTLNASYAVTCYEAIYIPILAEITGSLASISIYDDFINDVTLDGAHTFASGSIGGITTQVKPGHVEEFSQTVLLPDLTIQELAPRAMVASTLTIAAPAGYQWINVDQVQLSARNAGGAGISSRELSNEGANLSANPNVLKLGLTLNENPQEARAITLRNLQLAAIAGNETYGNVSITLSGCNMERESVLVANRVRVYYTFSAESLSLPKLVAGYAPAQANAEELRALKVTLEESVPGRWQASRRTAFTLPEGVNARAVVVSTYNLATDLPRDTLIRRIDENAFALNTEKSGSWILAANGLTVQNLSTLSDKAAKVELTFYLSADENYRGPVFLTAGGAALTHEASAAIADVVERSSGGTVALTIGSMEMKIGSVSVAMDVAPFIENGYTMAPVSFVARALGLPEGSVRWNGETRAVAIDTGNGAAVLTIDSHEMWINGVMKEIPQPPVIRDDRTFLPFRVLGEQVLGVAVGWDGDTGTAIFY
ncbi:MAG: copper amine oxidase N-terminal domain-containing protein [Clostridiales bacterium]|nr:copper amine oxidase N-terminal domain-containing protein [Clostridiales bacterium]